MVFNDDSLIKSIHSNSDCQSSTVTADISIQSVTKEGLKMTITLFLMIISGAIHHEKKRKNSRDWPINKYLKYLMGHDLPVDLTPEKLREIDNTDTHQYQWWMCEGGAMV